MGSAKVPPGIAVNHLVLVKAQRHDLDTFLPFLPVDATVAGERGGGQQHQGGRAKGVLGNLGFQQHVLTGQQRHLGTIVQRAAGHGQLTRRGGQIFAFDINDLAQPPSSV